MDVRPDFAKFTPIIYRHFCALASWLFLRTAESGAQSVLYAAVDANLDYVTGQYIE